MFLADISQAKCSHYIWHCVQQDEPASRLPSPFCRRPIVQIYTAQDEQCNQHPVRNLQQGRDEGRVAKTFDDNGSKVGDTAIRRVMDCTEEEEKVGLWVTESFDDLIWLEVLILDAGLVRAQACYRDETLPGSKEWSGRGAIGKKDEHYDAPDRAEGCANALGEIQLLVKNGGEHLPPMMRNSYFHDGREPPIWPIA